MNRKSSLQSLGPFLGAVLVLSVILGYLFSESFRIAERFDIAPKPGIANPSGLEDLTAVSAQDGALALFEFTGALPRAKFFTNWQVNTNNDAVLKQLADKAFDPSSAVIVSDAISGTPATNSMSGRAEIVSYSPRRIEVKVNAPAAGVLLLNDRYDKDWRATSDGEAGAMNCLKATFRAFPVRRYPPTFHTRQTRHSVPKFPRPSRSRSLSWGRRLG